MSIKRLARAALAFCALALWAAAGAGAGKATQNPSQFDLDLRGFTIRTMHDWATQNRFGNVTTPQLIVLAEQISGINLDAFFQAWLDTPGKPTSW